RLRFDGKFDLGRHARRDVELVCRIMWDDTDKFPLDLGDIAVHSIELYSVDHGRKRRRGQLVQPSHEGWVQDDGAERLVDVILDQLRIEHRDAHQPRQYLEARFLARGAETRLILLSLGVKTQGHDLADVHPEYARSAGGHD